jgi:hypothetical protein
MRSVAKGLTVVVFAACAAPQPPLPANGDDDDNDPQLPDRAALPTGDGGNVGNPVVATKPKITITLSGTGTGTIASTPGGVTCSGTTCTGTFALGTAVTLLPTATASSIFAGWGGACTGAASCAPILNADVQLGAQFESFPGTWTGTYTHNETANGCQFNNAGNMTLAVAAADGGASFATTNDATGFQLKSIPGCNLQSTQNGTAKDNITVNATSVTGTWNFSINGASSKLPLPFTATISVGTTGPTMKGTWTCAGCTGSFTLTKS